jgi:hypothetical protein
MDGVETEPSTKGACTNWDYQEGQSATPDTRIAAVEFEAEGEGWNASRHQHCNGSRLKSDNKSKQNR